MRWWAGAWVIAGVVVVAACGTSAGGGGSAGEPSGSRSVESATGTPTPTFADSSSPPSSAPPSSPAGAGTSEAGTSGAARTPSASGGACVAGHAEVTVAPGDAPRQRLCVRPGTVVSLILEPRSDDKRWVAVHSSAPVFVATSGWRVEGDGSARAALRCAGTRGGTAKVTALAKAPDVAGAAQAAFTVEVSVVPYATER